MKKSKDLQGKGVATVVGIDATGTAAVDTSSKTDTDTQKIQRKRR